MSTVEVMVTAQVQQSTIVALQRHFTVHHREHIQDPSVLHRVRAVVCEEGSRISRDWMALLPHLDLICLTGPDAHGVDLAEELLDLLTTDGARCIDSHHDVTDPLGHTTGHVNIHTQVAPIGPLPRGVIVTRALLLHILAQCILPPHLGLKQTLQLPVTTGSDLACKQRTLTQRLVEIVRIVPIEEVRLEHGHLG